MLIKTKSQSDFVNKEVGRNMLIFIPLALLLGFIGTCCFLKCCKRTPISDIEPIGDEIQNNDLNIDYTQLLSPK